MLVSTCGTEAHNHITTQPCTFCTPTHTTAPLLTPPPPHHCKHAQASIAPLKKGTLELQAAHPLTPLCPAPTTPLTPC
jgi:hypothetical protein